MNSSIVRERRIKLFFFLMAVLMLFLALAKINNLLVSFILAIVTSYLMAPSVDFLERRGFSRQLATILPFLILTILLAVIVQVFFPVFVTQALTMKSNFHFYQETIIQFITKAESEFGRIVKDYYPMDFKSSVMPQMMGWAKTIFQDLPNYISQSLMIIFLTPLLSFFILLDGRDFVRRLLTLVPNNYFELTLNLNFQIANQIGGFIRARFIQSILVGLFIWLGLLIMGFPYALVLAIFAGVLNVIPYLGPLIGVIPSLIISFANGGNSGDITWIASIYTAAQVLDTVLITPFVVAKIVDLHPVTVILVIILGSQLMGILGMIICIPVFSALKVTSIALYKHLTDFRS